MQSTGVFMMRCAVINVKNPNRLLVRQYSETAAAATSSAQVLYFVFIGCVP